MEVSESVTFEEAIAFTQNLMTQMEANKLSETEISQAIASLVKTMNGARGFFVTYLTDEKSLADHPSVGVIKGLQSSPAIISDLLVKNLAMSSAMAVTHQRNQNEEMLQGSKRVTRRTHHLIKLIDLEIINDELTQLQQSVSFGEGKYQDFLQRWGYDQEQLDVIAQALSNLKSV